MKIFGIEFETRRELKKKVTQLAYELCAIQNVFPLTLGQIVYDVQFRNENGKYTKKNASLEHSLINEVIVDKKNYFGLVDRYNRNDVFLSYDEAKAFLEKVCVKK